MKQLSLFDPIEISLTQGYITLIDVVDADLAEFKWYALKNHCAIYAQRADYSNGGQKTVHLHRVIASRLLGRTLEQNEQVDHIDSNGLNNRRDNLRLASIDENVRNKKLTVKNTSGFKGVSWAKDRQKWHSSIRAHNHNYNLGYFDTPQEAHLAYCKAARELHGEFANFG